MFKALVNWFKGKSSDVFKRRKIHGGWCPPKMCEGCNTGTTCNFYKKDSRH